MSQELYYIAPEQHLFDEMKKLSIAVWNTYDNQFWYVDEKVNLIKDIQNIRDNFMYMFAMFDCRNQRKIIQMASPELIKAIKERLWEYYPFNY